MLPPDTLQRVLERLLFYAYRREIRAALAGDRENGKYLYRPFTQMEEEWLRRQGFTRGSGWLWYLEDGIYPKMYIAGDKSCCCKGFIDGDWYIVRGSLPEVHEGLKRLVTAQTSGKTPYFGSSPHIGERARR